MTSKSQKYGRDYGLELFPRSLRGGHYACGDRARVKACLPASSLVWLNGNERGPQSDTSFRRPPSSKNLARSCGSLCVFYAFRWAEGLRTTTPELCNCCSSRVKCLCVCLQVNCDFVCIYQPMCVCVCVDKWPVQAHRPVSSPLAIIMSLPFCHTLGSPGAITVSLQFWMNKKMMGEKHCNSSSGSS